MKGEAKGLQRCIGFVKNFASSREADDTRQAHQASNLRTREAQPVCMGCMINAHVKLDMDAWDVRPGCTGPTSWVQGTHIPVAWDGSLVHMGCASH